MNRRELIGGSFAAVGAAALPAMPAVRPNGIDETRAFLERLLRDFEEDRRVFEESLQRTVDLMAVSIKESERSFKEVMELHRIRGS